MAVLDRPLFNKPDGSENTFCDTCVPQTSQVLKTCEVFSINVSKKIATYSRAALAMKCLTPFFKL